MEFNRFEGYNHKGQERRNSINSQLYKLYKLNEWKGYRTAMKETIAGNPNIERTEN